LCVHRSSDLSKTVSAHSQTERKDITARNVTIGASLGPCLKHARLAKISKSSRGSLHFVAMAKSILIITDDSGESLEIYYAQQRFREAGYQPRIAATQRKLLRRHRF
jgi:hypothetical protein